MADLVWSPGRARADQAERTELWDLGKVRGHWRKGRAVGVMSIESAGEHQIGLKR